MADGVQTESGSGRIRREDADRVLIAALVHVAASIHDDPNREVALHLIARALPMASRSTRIEALRPAAECILLACRLRRKPGEGARAWCRAHLDLSTAIARDALRQALALVEV